MKNLIYCRFVLIFIILIVAIMTVQSPFSFHHYEYPPILLYLLITILNALIYLILSSKLIVAEKILYAFVVSSLALFGGTIFTEIILESIYGHDVNFDTLQSPIMLQNILFYFFTNLFCITTFWIWLKYRKEIYT